MRLASCALEALDTKEKGSEPPSRWVVPPSWIVFGRQSAIY